MASIPASMLPPFVFLSSFNTVPVVVFVLLKWPEETLGDLVQGVLGEAVTITVFGKAGREALKKMRRDIPIFNNFENISK